MGDNEPIPVAVVGMSCRVPGAEGTRDFWRLLTDGVDAITDVPVGRWPEIPELAGFGRGGYIDDVAGFDAEFFGISPREAAAMDPRQRMALELSWAALEDAGMAPDSLRGSAAAVFLGATGDDYTSLVHRSGPDAISHHSLAGLSRGLIANRVSHQLGLRGPSLTVDTVQSSSLVAVHMACESLRSGAVGMALAGGVHLNLVPESTLALARAGALSPDGRSYTFDERANGFVKGEGAGIVVLKRLDDAVADGDPVYAVVLGGAVNHDGDGAALTVPDLNSQQALLRAAHAQAGVDAVAVQYVELHGTGTRAGDPIEAGALGAVFGPSRAASDPLLVGSAKTNVGHLDAAAGVIGLIKVALAMRHGLLPASLNFSTPHPSIPLHEWKLRVHAKTGPWPAGEAKLAGVSSFGVGGTNCHLVLGAHPVSLRTQPLPHPQLATAVPVVVSGRTAVAMRAQAGRLADWVSADPDLSVLDVGYSALASRSLMKHRAVVVATGRAELADSLAALAAGEPAANVVTGSAAAEPGVVWVFPGQGSQWVGMASGLWDSTPVFGTRMAECQQVLDGLVDWSLRDVLNDEAALARVDVVQPVLFAVMVSLAQVWRSAGVVPAAVVGHSQGEIAAACAAGIIELPDALRLVVLRAKAIAAGLAGHGTMASLAMSADGVDENLVQVAAVNGPNSVVISGAVDAVRSVVAECETRGVRAKVIPVDYASHSAQVEAIRDEVLHAAEGVATTAGPIAFYSTVTGGPVAAGDLDAEYWYRNLRERVRFAETVATLASAGHGVFIEVSPHPVLAMSIEDTVPAAVVQGTLRRNEDEARRLLLSMASLLTAGVPVDWQPLFADAQRVDLPTYEFQRQQYWVNRSGESPAPAPAATAGTEAPAARTEQDVWTVVRSHAAAVLGHGDAQLLDRDSTFKELGFDSVTAVELRNRLNAAMALTLPTSVLFDHPTPTALVARMQAGLGGRNGDHITYETSEGRDDDPIAIVGMSCRLPGGIASPEDLWRVVADGIDTIAPFPDDRGWPAEPAAKHARVGGFLYGAGDFDAGFFRISPREALTMDPQQRLVLELVWEALERTGQDPHALRRSRTAVFMGSMSQDYLPRLHDVPDNLGGHALTGGASSVVSGRVAYALGLEGPAVTVDTACSSSLVALHLAAQSLRSGDCSLALAGGVTVLSTPGIFVEFARQGGLANDGRCKAFADSADGTGWSEGVGVLVLERLSDARRNGRNVLAVLRGSAINQDGESNGLTAPNGPSQERVIRHALANAGLSAADVDAVEAHGTGTSLGDPIEAQALLATYGQDRSHPLWLGSVKSNIGHTQAAAGVAGVIKMIMAMRHGALPRTLHVEQPTRQVDWSSGAVELLAEDQKWPETDTRRVAVSSFGISGTNAHVILEQGDETPVRADCEPTGVLAWLVSARSQKALAGQAAKLATATGSAPDIAFSLATTRSAFDHRAVVLGSNLDELRAGLNAVAQGTRAHGVFVGNSSSAPDVGVLFSGQGSQRLGMSRELVQTFPVFADAWHAVCAELDPLLDQSIDEVVGAEPGSEFAGLLDETAMTQPALFAFEVASFRLLESFGVVPTVLVGHSIGELAAAHVAGVFTLPDAAKLVACRGKLMQALPRGGTMVAVEAGEAEVRGAINGNASAVSIAAVNSIATTVISGAEDAVAEVTSYLAEQGRRTKRLRVSHAFHSSLMEPMLASFGEVARSVTYSVPRIPVVSNVTGAIAEPGALERPEYWVRHVREAVRFADGVRAAVTAGVGMLVEVGPDGVLSGMAEEVLAAAGAELPVIPVSRRNKSELRSLAEALAQLQVAGVKIDWRSYFAAIGVVGHRIDLPTYAFDRQRFWVPAASPHTDVSDAGLDRIEHPILAAATELAVGDQLVLTGRVSRSDHSWLADHTIFGSVVFPGAAFVELAHHAATAAGCRSVAELTLQAPLIVGEEPAQLQIIVGSVEDEVRREVGIYSRTASDPSWIRHAAGSLSTAEIPEPALQEWPPEDATPIDTADLYTRLADRGYGYGPAFQGIRKLWRSDDEIFGEIALPEHVPVGAFAIHPALFDAALQPMLSLFEASSSEALLPYSWSGVSYPSTGSSGSRTVNVRIARTGATEVSLSIVDPEGSTVLAVEALTMLPASAEQVMGVTTQNSLLTVEWVQLPLAPDAKAPLEVVDVAGRPDGDVPIVSKQVLHNVLGRLQERLRDERPALPRLAVVTTRAVAIGSGESPDLSVAAVLGLVRSVQAEHPDQFVLVDVDDYPESRRAIDAAASSGESQVVLRRGVAFVPRLAQLPVAQTSPPSWNPNGTVLITGATGGLGTLFARHLVADCGVRHLLLLSRTAPGSPDQIAELTALGAQVAHVPCDVSDAAALAEQVARISAEAPLSAVVHLAGILDDGAAESLTPERIDAVLRPKVDAAWYLHELTKSMKLDAFVLFSSVASTIGTPGQANYAAANAFLDALAVHRKSIGLPATALAWGPWAVGMAARLGEVDVARFRRSGIVPIAAEAGTALFDAALASDAPVLTPLGVVPAVFQTVAATQPDERPAEPSMVQRLRELAPAAQRKEMVDLLLSTAAIVLDYPSTDDIDPDQSFKEIGFDSLSGVEFRNQVRKDTGVQIPPTVVFNYPTPAALADRLLQLLFGAEQDEASDTDVSVDSSNAVSQGVDDEIDALDVENLISRAFAE